MSRKLFSIKTCSLVEITVKIISPKLREVLEVAQNNYIINLLSIFKKDQYNVVCSSKELIIIDTDKKNFNDCQLFASYILQKVNGLMGYDLVNLKIIRTFEKLSIIDVDSFFYLNDRNYCNTMNCSIPDIFFNLYFSDKEITNDKVYDVVKFFNLTDVKILLKIISYKRSVYGLASNCYKLLGRSDFDEKCIYTPNLTVFCIFENILRKKCFKCFSEINIEILERASEHYLNYLAEMQLMGNKYCDKCGIYSEYKLKYFCVCGGIFKEMDFLSEISSLEIYINTNAFSKKVMKIKEFFDK